MKKIGIILFLLLFPCSVFAEDFLPNAKSGLLMEFSTGKIIFEKEKDLEVSVASMTKMVAQIIILEDIKAKKIKWNDMVTVSQNASSMGGSQIYLETGEKMSVEDLMKGISVASGNDATVAMAEYISGTEEKFVERMNQKVKELGLEHTHFQNCTGLDEENHYSSSYDMAVIARELLMKYPEILRFSSIYEDYLRKDTDRKFWLVNTNKLISQYEGVDGLKTGHTDDAGYCLAATAKRDDLRFIAINLGESDSKVRNKETMDLLDYGFQSVKMKTLKKKGSIVKTVSLSKTEPKKIIYVLKDNLNVIESPNEKKNYTYNIKLKKISYPIKKGDSLGIIQVKDAGKILSSVSLISNSNIRSLSFFELFRDSIKGVLFGVF